MACQSKPLLDILMMSHHSLNLKLNLNLPASQKPLYRSDFRYKFCVWPFTQPFQDCDQRGAGSFMCAVELV